MNKTIRLSGKVYILIALAITISLAQYYFYDRGQERQSLLQTFFVLTSRLKNESSELKYHLMRSAYDGDSEKVLRTYREIFSTIQFSRKFYGDTDIDFKKKDYVLENFDKIEKIYQVSFEEYMLSPKQDIKEVIEIVEQIDAGLKVISSMIIEMVAYTDQQLKINENVNLAFSISSVLIVIIILATIIVPQILQLENLNLELTSSNTLRESIQNSSPNGILFIINRQVYLFNNRAKELIHDLTEKQLMKGQLLDDLPFPEDVKSEFEKGIKSSLEGNTFHGYFSFTNTDGEVLYYKVLFYPVYDILTKSNGTSIIFSNITKEIRAKEQIKKSEEYYKTIIDNSHGIIFSLTDTFQIKFVSHLVEKYLGSKPDSLIGTNFMSLVRESDRQRVEFFLKKVLNNISTEDQIQFFLNAGKNETILMGKCGLIVSNDSKEIILLCIDITSQVKNEEKLQVQNEKLREIAWLQSHVIRRPVANALGIIEVLQNEELLSANTEELNREKLLQLLISEIQNIDKTIHDINEKTQEL